MLRASLSLSFCHVSCSFLSNSFIFKERGFHRTREKENSEHCIVCLSRRLDSSLLSSLWHKRFKWWVKRSHSHTYILALSPSLSLSLFHTHRNEKKRKESEKRKCKSFQNSREQSVLIFPWTVLLRDPALALSHRTAHSTCMRTALRILLHGSKSCWARFPGWLAFNVYISSSSLSLSSILYFLSLLSSSIFSFFLLLLGWLINRGIEKRDEHSKEERGREEAPFSEHLSWHHVYISQIYRSNFRANKKAPGQENKALVVCWW